MMCYPWQRPQSRGPLRMLPTFITDLWSIVKVAGALSCIAFVRSSAIVLSTDSQYPRHTVTVNRFQPGGSRHNVPQWATLAWLGWITDQHHCSGGIMQSQSRSHRSADRARYVLECSSHPPTPPPPPLTGQTDLSATGRWQCLSCLRSLETACLCGCAAARQEVQPLRQL